MSEQTENTETSLASPLKKVKHSTVRQAKYSFQSDETERMGRDLAEKCASKKELEDDKKSIQSEFKAKIDAVDAEINLLTKHISQGFMFKKYSCEVYLDFDNGVKYFRDKISGEMIDKERMSSDDYQLELDLR